MISIEKRTYLLVGGRRLTLAFFAGEERFCHTLQDHMLNAAEPWHRLLGLKIRDSLCQKMDSDDVSVIGEAIADAYTRCVEVLDAGIQFSIGYPVYVECDQKRSAVGGKNWYETAVFFFLSRDGLVIVVRDNVVRTARFASGVKGSDLSRQTLFRQAWKYVKDSVRSKGYRDAKGGEDVINDSVLMVSPDNWARCPVVR